jgi:hypothetical protein
VRVHSNLSDKLHQLFKKMKSKKTDKKEPPPLLIRQRSNSSSEMLPYLLPPVVPVKVKSKDTESIYGTLRRKKKVIIMILTNTNFTQEHNRTCR